MLSLPEASQYLTRGGESEIYLAPDHLHVIKVNDAVYYATWTEYFNSLVIHNLMFPNTAYELLGFTSIINGEKEQFKIHVTRARRPLKDRILNH